MIKERLVDYIKASITDNWTIEALSDYKGAGYTYAEIAARIQKFHMIFDKAGIKQGDKVSLLGKNSAHWCATYLATVTYGAVSVPIMPDFKPDDLTNIINHSDSRLLLVDEKIWETLEFEDLPELSGVYMLEDFGFATGRDKELEKFSLNIDDEFNKVYPSFNAGDIKYSDIDNEEMAVLSYTSGTTGFSKGVMVPHRSLAGNVRFAQNNMPLKPGDKIVSFLPLAHTLGCAFEFLFPFTYGCHITILTKTPSPAVILGAFGEIKPRLIISVPLVIEKVYKKRLLPALSKPHMKLLLALPGINKILYKKVLEKFSNSFGGNFIEMVIGGAALNHDVENFFRKIKLPFTVGYGMTECGPLISYSPWATTKPQACGRPVDTLEVTIDSSDPQNEVGEIIVRGSNVMLGYYKNEKATSEAIDKDGWLHTGDLGVIDKEGNIYIRGRSKNMLLGPSGQNIFPEEIESAINNQPYIVESVVISENNKLIALVYPDSEQIKAEGVTNIDEVFNGLRKELNHSMPSYMNVAEYRVHDSEFEKTPKKTIKRFIYT
jgi:long-chain acyl-CoA synthetase